MIRADISYQPITTRSWRHITNSCDATCVFILSSSKQTYEPIRERVFYKLCKLYFIRQINIFDPTSNTRVTLLRWILGYNDWLWTFTEAVKLADRLELWPAAEMRLKTNTPCYIPPISDFLYHRMAKKCPISTARSSERGSWATLLKIGDLIKQGKDL